MHWNRNCEKLQTQFYNIMEGNNIAETFYLNSFLLQLYCTYLLDIDTFGCTTEVVRIRTVGLSFHDYIKILSPPRIMAGGQGE